MRHKHRSWQNDKTDRGTRHPNGWTCRIIWYQESDGVDIRLQLEDSERKVNIYPKTKEAAEHIFFMFRTQQAASPAGETTPCISDLLELIKDKIIKGESLC